MYHYDEYSLPPPHGFFFLSPSNDKQLKDHLFMGCPQDWALWPNTSVPPGHGPGLMLIVTRFSCVLLCIFGTRRNGFSTVGHRRQGLKACTWLMRLCCVFGVAANERNYGQGWGPEVTIVFSDVVANVFRSCPFLEWFTFSGSRGHLSSPGHLWVCFPFLPLRGALSVKFVVRSRVVLLVTVTAKNT